MIPLPPDAAARRDNLGAHLRALKAHDLETATLAADPRSAPIGTFPSRDDERRRLSSAVEIAADVLHACLVAPTAPECPECGHAPHHSPATTSRAPHSYCSARASWSSPDCGCDYMPEVTP